MTAPRERTRDISLIKYERRNGYATFLLRIREILDSNPGLLIEVLMGFSVSPDKCGDFISNYPLRLPSTTSCPVYYSLLILSFNAVYV
jgi:hypothetical protein